MSKNFIVGFWVLFLMCFVGGCLYFVAGVSATSPPIRIYKCYEGVDRFESGIKNLTNSTNDLRYVITDTVGDANVGIAKYMTLFVKKANRDIEYGLKYETKADYAEVKLIMALDRQKFIGGYSLDADGMESLLKIFENDVLKRLERTQKINFNQDKSFWTKFSIY